MNHAAVHRRAELNRLKTQHSGAAQQSKVSLTGGSRGRCDQTSVGAGSNTDATPRLTLDDRSAAGDRIGQIKARSRDGAVVGNRVIQDGGVLDAGKDGAANGHRRLAGTKAEGPGPN